MKRTIGGFLLMLVLTAMLSGSALAESYSFQVPRQVVDVYVNDDGTMSLDYIIDIRNNPGASDIEIIDIVTPNNDYELNSVSAEIDGTPITDIQRSDYVDMGVMVNLGGKAIQAGMQSRLHIYFGIIRNMIYPYTYEEKTENYVSFNFVPNTFDPSLISGSTDMTVTLLLPPGITTEEPIYYTPKNWPGDAAPESGYDEQNRVYYTWQTGNANTYTDYTFGGAFPARFVPESSIVRAPARKITINEDSLCCWGVGLVFAAIFGFSIYQGTVGARKRKLAYLPPKVSIEGHGIKRGLTAVEAAILMEQPVDKVLPMILFGAIKKGAAEVATRDPLKLTVTDPLPEGLHQYEISFLEAFKQTEAAAQRRGLQDTIVNLVKSLSEKMKGFSRKETVAYYKDIMKRAWAEVEAAGTPEVKGQKYSDYLEWTMLDGDYQDRTRDVFRTGPIFVPAWWGRYDPVYRSGSGGSAGAPTISTGSGSSGGQTISLPHLPGSDFAASVINGASSFSAGVVKDVAGFTSGISNRTNPAPVATSSGSSRSGGSRGGGSSGHSCACACACAGCACACAGGGR